MLYAGRKRTLNDCSAVAGKTRMSEVDADVDKTVVLHRGILLELRDTMNHRAHTTVSDDLPMDWVGDWAGRRRALTPHRLAVIDADNDRHFDYVTLDTRVKRVAAWLRDEAGLGKGDVVALISGNRLEAVELALACGKLGIVVAPVSHRLAPREAAALLARLAPQCLFHDAASADFVARLGAQREAIPRFCLDGPDSDHARMLLAPEPQRIGEALALSDTALIVHTGGSTGLPKLCQISHRQMVWNAIELLVAAPDGLGGRRELVLFPLFHIGGWNTVLPVLYGGGCVVLQAGFDPAAALAAIARYGVNHLGAVEAMLQAMTSAPEFGDTDLSSLAGITTAGAPCAEASMAPFFARGIPVSQSYGLTEAGPSNFIHGRDGQSIASLRGDYASVGSSFFHCDYRIVDPVSGDEVDIGTPGELRLRSPHSFDGYLDDATATAERMLPGGWVRSGDLAVERPEGGVQVIGRLDNVIVSGGENVAAEELEAALREHPAVTGALVFGLPHDRWGERPAAWVTRHPGTAITPSGIAEWLSGRLAGFKRPTLIRVVEALPLTGAGKLDRRAAKDQQMQELPGDKP